jgi:hypothetical protein
MRLLCNTDEYLEMVIKAFPQRHQVNCLWFPLLQKDKVWSNLFFFFFLAVLESEFRVLYLLGRCSITWATSSAQKNFWEHTTFLIYIDTEFSWHSNITILALVICHSFCFVHLFHFTNGALTGLKHKIL